MGTDINLRKMALSEYQEISHRSFEEYFVECSLVSGESVDSIRSRVGAAPTEPSSNDRWYMVEKEGQSCGYCWVQIDTPKKEAFGYDIFLEKAVRGMGLGRQVMEKGKKLLGEMGINKVKICVFEGNSPARGLYGSLGFKEIRRVPTKGQIELETVF